MRFGLVLLLWVMPVFVHAAEVCAIFAPAVGDKHSLSLEITSDLINKTAEATGDYNPMHMDEKFATKAGLTGVIPHGVLLKGLIETVLTNHLPGPSAVLVREKAKYYGPAYVGDVVTATCEITSIDDDGTIQLTTILSNQRGEILIDGSASVRQSLDNRPEISICPQGTCSEYVSGSMELPKAKDEKSSVAVVAPDSIREILALTGNTNPVHTNEQYARSLGYEGVTAPSMLVKGLLSNLLGNDFPGPGAMFTVEDTTHGEPVYSGDTLTARAYVQFVRPKVGAMKMLVSVTNQRGQPVIYGEVILFYKPMPPDSAE